MVLALPIPDELTIVRDLLQLGIEDRRVCGAAIGAQVDMLARNVVPDEVIVITGSELQVVVIR